MVSTLRAVAEALVLDAGSSPPADLPAEAVPPGWTVRWLAREALTSVPGARDDVTGWAVDVRGPASSGCAIWVRRTTAADPPVVGGTSPGDRLTTVHGQEAVVYPGLQVRWDEPSGARVSVWCLLPALDDIVDLADSLAPVALDDPRIPPGGGRAGRSRMSTSGTGRVPESAAWAPRRHRGRSSGATASWRPCRPRSSTRRVAA